MEKHFTEVFPPLHIEQPLTELLEQVRVERVTSNRAKTHIKVYLTSGKLIHKEQIFHLEQTLKKQLFGKNPIELKIIEHFRLSSQYTPQKVLELYRDSILFELRAYSILEFNLFRRAEITFPKEDHMKLSLEKTTLGQEAADELIRVLHKIFTERCGMKLEIEAELVDKNQEQEEKRRKSQEFMEKQAAALTERMHQAEQDQAAAQGELQPEKETAAPAGKAAAAKTPKEKKPRPSFGKDDYPYRRTLRSGGSNGKSARASDPDVLYGRSFEDGELTELCQIIGEMGEVTVRGQVSALDEREIRGEKTIVTITITDYTDTIRAKLFIKNEDLPGFRENVKKGAFVRIKGITAIDRFDNELTLSSLTGIKKSADFRKLRVDNHEHKRVELHCHTKMSDMDGVSEVKDLIKQAKAWGHKAIAVTDHGVVQAYPDASHSDQAKPLE